MSSSRTSGRSAASCASLTSDQRHGVGGPPPARRDRRRGAGRRGCGRSGRRRAPGRAAAGRAPGRRSPPPPCRRGRTRPRGRRSGRRPARRSARARWPVRTIGCTVKPVMRGSGRCAPGARQDRRAAASRTSASLVRSSATPPTSDLCTMSGETTFSATAPPAAMIVQAAAAAASASGASVSGTARDAVGLEHARRPRRDRASAAPRRRRGATIARGGLRSGAKSRGSESGVPSGRPAPRGSARGGGSPDRLGLGGEVRDAGARAKIAAGRLVVAEPHREDRLCGVLPRGAPASPCRRSPAATAAPSERAVGHVDHQHRVVGRGRPAAARGRAA